MSTVTRGHVVALVGASALVSPLLGAAVGSVIFWVHRRRLHA